MTKKEFIDTVAPVAVMLRKVGSPIFPSVRIAQALLETGAKIHTWNNLVGLKVGSGWTSEWWQGAYVSKGTWEVIDGQRHDNVQAHFRAYESIEHCFRDQDVLFSFSRYKAVREANTPEVQAVALYRCGYATDPNYYKKLLNLIDQHDLKLYDKAAKQKSSEMSDYTDMPDIQDQVPVNVYGVEMQGYLIANKTYVEVRKYSDLHGDIVTWNNAERKVYIERKTK